METLYTRDIIRLATGLNAIRLSKPDASAFKKSRICGSSITVDIQVKAGRVTAFGAEVKACALGQASTAIVEQHIAGSNLEDIMALKALLSDLLQGKGVSFPPPWEALGIFEKAQPHKARHSAILLPFEALEEALNIQK